MDLTPFSLLREVFSQREELRSNESINRILNEVRESPSSSEPFYRNYSKSSYSVAEDEKDQLSKLKKSFESIDPEASTFDQLLKVNQFITEDESVVRDYDYEHVPFCSYSQIEAGISLINSSESNHFVDLVGISQLVLSLHFFKNANHRTSRLWLDYKLIEVGLIPTTFNNPTEWLIANISGYSECSLESATQRTLYLLGNSISKKI